MTRSSLSLAIKYDRPVPRYTSYPTAPHFSDSVGEEAYRAWLAELDPSKPLSLYIHVPLDRKSTRLNSSHSQQHRMPPSA